MCGSLIVLVWGKDDAFAAREVSAEDLPDKSMPEGSDERG